jgi:hypothetical protein
VKPDIRILTLLHCFSRPIQNEIRLADRLRLLGQKFNAGFARAGWPMPKQLCAYPLWDLFITQTLADWPQQRTPYTLGHSPHRSESWNFERRQPPKPDNDLNVGTLAKLMRFILTFVHVRGRELSCRLMVKNQPRTINKAIL